MNGLLTKDFLIIKGQKNTMLIVVLTSIIMAFSFDTSVLVIYATILGSILSLGTLSYDEFDNGFAYLFTLPVSRKTYVREKYLFSLGGCIAFMLVGFVLAAILSLFKQTSIDILSSGLSSMFAGIIMISIMIPLRLKYGSEKSRIALFVVYGVIALILFAGKSILESLGIKEAAMMAIVNASTGVVITCIIIIAIVVFVASEKISEKIMENKEY